MSESETGSARFPRSSMRRHILRSGLCGMTFFSFFGHAAATDPWTPDAKRPAYVQALEAHYGKPNQNGFGSTVLFKSEIADKAALERQAQAAYQFFVGALWDKRGTAVWMDPWRLLYERSNPADIVSELRMLSDPLAQSSGDMLLEAVSEPEAARGALVAAFDDPIVRDMLIFSVGDGDAMSGVLITARRDSGEAVFLVFLMD